MVSRLISNLVPTRNAISKLIKNNEIIVFSKTTCPFCKKVKDLFNKLNKDYTFVELDKIENGNKIQTTLFNLTGQKTVPSIFFNGLHLGGCSDLTQCYDKNELDIFEKNSFEIKELIDNKNNNFEYDLAVIGGGSGGLACAKKAASYGAKVVLFDYVTPTPLGTKWGIGGTCVNVGCIPKKLFHQSSIYSESINQSNSYGWQVPKATIKNFNWFTLVQNVQNHIKSLNFNYRSTLMKKNIKNVNAIATFKDKHTIKTIDKDGNEILYKSKFIVLATGERPIYPGIEGDKECCITSDDLFSLSYTPGKTLVIGASYVALECAGFLRGLGYDTTVMVRSILLRGFDQEMANKIGNYMEKHGVKFLKQCIPEKFIKLKDIDYENKKSGLIQVTYKDSNGQIYKDEYNTVLLAIGRSPLTKNTLVDKIGIKLDNKERVIGIADTEMTHISNIFAIGDILSGKPQLTPMAIQSGNLLADRLFGLENFDKCDYSNVPTTVFTPIEYGCVGYSEDEAINKFGDDVDIFHNYIHYLESTILPDADPNDYYAKLITRPSLNNKVIGFHILAPNAGEITQGFALGIKMGATLKDFSNVIGIHPTCAEVFTSLTVSKKGDNKIEATGC